VTAPIMAMNQPDKGSRRRCQLSHGNPMIRVWVLMVDAISGRRPAMSAASPEIPNSRKVPT